MSPEVFAYLDYREFLRDFYSARKAESDYSFRSFSRRAGLKSPNYLKLVMDGDRNLTAKMSIRFAAACHLEGPAADYFTALVAFGQAKDVEERNARYSALQRFKRYRQNHQLAAAQDAYHSKWYLPAIRELVSSVSFREDPVWIAERLSPKIKATEAELALDTLVELGLLVRDANGRLRQVDKTVSTGPDHVRSLHLANYHRALMNHAMTSLDRLPPSDRDITGLTLCLGTGGMARLKQRLAAFRRELLELAELEESPEQVVQVGFQLFALSHPEEKEPAS